MRGIFKVLCFYYSVLLLCITSFQKFSENTFRFISKEMVTFPSCSDVSHASTQLCAFEKLFYPTKINNFLQREYILKNTVKVKNKY